MVLRTGGDAPGAGLTIPGRAPPSGCRRSAGPEAVAVLSAYLLAFRNPPPSKRGEWEPGQGPVYRPEAMSPAYSRGSKGWGWICPAATRFSSGEVILSAFDPDSGPLEHVQEEGIALLSTPGELRLRIDRGVHGTGQFSGCGLQGRKQVPVGQ